MRSRPTATRVTGYIRVSTDLQSDEGVSLDAQREKLQQYAALFNLVLVAIHVDAGLSAKTLARPGLQAALADLREGRADGLVVAKLDRLTRSVRDLGELLEAYFTSEQWALLSVNEQIDTRTAAGRLMLHILGSVSEWERATIGERTAEALAHLKSKGVALGGDALGWRRTSGTDADGRRVVELLEGEQSTVDRIVALRGEGRSLRDIASMLTGDRVPTKRGGRWQAQTVAKILARARLGVPRDKVLVSG